MAMKLEEVDLVALTSLAVPDDGKKVMHLEQSILRALKYRLLPDTINFWLQSIIKFWEHFMTH